MNWVKLNDRVIRSRNGRWQIARYQDVPHACYELWDIRLMNKAAGINGKFITTDRDAQALKDLAAHHEFMEVV